MIHDEQFALERTAQGCGEFDLVFYQENPHFRSSIDGTQSAGDNVSGYSRAEPACRIRRGDSRATLRQHCRLACTGPGHMAITQAIPGLLPLGRSPAAGLRRPCPAQALIMNAQHRHQHQSPVRLRQGSRDQRDDLAEAVVEPDDLAAAGLLQTARCIATLGHLGIELSPCSRRGRTSRRGCNKCTHQ